MQMLREVKVEIPLFSTSGCILNQPIECLRLEQLVQSRATLMVTLVTLVYARS